MTVIVTATITKLKTNRENQILFTGAEGEDLIRAIISHLIIIPRISLEFCQLKSKPKCVKFLIHLSILHTPFSQNNNNLNLKMARVRAKFAV